MNDEHMPLVLFNICWMQHYRGQTPDDPIHGGGAYPDEHGHGFEVENFLPIGGWYYGHGEPPRSGVINLKRVDPGVGDAAEYLDGVTVVFVATRPDEGGRVVVGWYRNARVWRNLRQRPSPGHDRYCAEARVEDCILLGVDDRTFDVPTGRRSDGVFGMGRTIRYTFDDHGNHEPDAEEFVPRLQAYIEGSTPVQEPATMSLNTILCGPPGTGKTYATAQRCVEICDGPAKRSGEEIRDRYRALVKEGRVEFITFHQSYGYEEFVEGLRPDTGGDEANEEAGPGIRLVATEGVLKRIAERARKVAEETDRAFELADRRIFKMSLGDPADPEQQGIFGECIANDYVVLGYGGDVDWSDERYGNPDRILARWQENDPNATGRNPNVSFVNQLRNTMQTGDLVIVPRGFQHFRAVGEVTGPYRFVPRDDGGYFHRRAVRWHWHDAENGMPISEIYDRPLTRPTIYKLDKSGIRLERLQRYLGQVEGSGRPSPHVLVIDEINRANVSKVMGELVTLLEDDKREGRANEVAVTLPHSRRSFTLPANLHILGTMNTADRSIALLDTALRRRFDFEERLPDPKRLRDAAEETDIDLPKVLRAMNERLEWLIDRDHLIGHAWLMGARTREDVDRAMRRKIIPLIVEYFYDDWEKVRAVLGGTGDFVQRKRLDPPPGLDDPGEVRYRWTVRTRFKKNAYKRLVAGAAAADRAG